MISQRLLIIVMLALAGFGLLAVFSSTRADHADSYLIRQAIWVCLGFGVMVIASLIRIKTLSAFAPIIYLLSIVMLVLVLVIGSGPHGTRRWFDLGFFRFQPSEIAKIAVILLLSRFLSDRKVTGNSIRNVLAVFAAAGLPALLVLYEPDLGTALVIAFMVFPMLHASGLDPLYLLFLLSPFLAMISAGEIVAWVIFVAFLITVMVLGRFKTSLVALVFGINFVVGSLAPRLWMGLAPYQRQRVLAFLNPENYRHGAGFQILQSQIAIGSGGLTGKGVFKGTQKALGLVPEQHTDFVFSVVGEELGFVGSAIILILLLYLILRIFGIARMVRNRFATYVCFGMASLFLIQVFVNVGMNLGLTPVTGLPLPFLSYGGSQTIVSWGAVGLVISAYHARREY